MSKRGLIPLLLLIVFITACRQAEPDHTSEVARPLEIEDVAPPIDVGLSTEEDVKGPSMVVGMSGVLPSNYPRNLPTYEPSSIVEFGAGADGWWFVELDTASTLATVSANLRQRLSAAGWSVSDDGAGRLRASKGAVRVRLAFMDADPGTRIRVDYR